jgi:WhiB family transcriptional regulator, redox-sensing transcriptional regulator
MDVTEPRRNDRITRALARGASRDGMRKTGELADTTADIDHAALYVAASASWMPLGACREEDPELFFPVGSRGPALSQVMAARAVCGRCPVRRECLSYALRAGQHDGIWGGSTGEERLTMRKAVVRRVPEFVARRVAPNHQEPAILPGAPFHPLAMLVEVLTEGPP